MLMNSSDFLLGVAGVAATLIGTFIVGVFFYLDTDLHRMMMSSDAADHYLRSSVRWVFAVYALPLFVALNLAVFEPIWGAVTFIAISVIVILSTVDTGRRMLRRRGAGESIGLVVNQWACSAAVVVVVALPWIIGGWVPPAEAFIPSIVLALAAAFASTVALIMKQFDLTAAMAESSPADHESDSAPR
jgi:hypothetical protein